VAEGAEAVGVVAVVKEAAAEAVDDAELDNSMHSFTLVTVN
jgi:hypothetical protein